MSQTVSAKNTTEPSLCASFVLWGLAENYDLCLNSSKLGIDGCVDLILNCCK